MKIVVMSDTHLNHATDELERICSRYCDGADLVIHLGDWACGSILNFMERYPLEAVCGNMDDHVIRERLPVKKVVHIGGFRVGMTHGWGSGYDLPRRLMGEFQGVDAMLFGHTHQPLVKQDNGVLLFNPGSVFLGRGTHAQTLGILHVEEGIQGEIVVL
ncbi:MAG: metallophosphoesterase family protein [Syntrophobacteraceae bacterium]